MSHITDPKVELRWFGGGGDYAVGAIHFPRSPSAIQAKRSADGLALTIPASVELRQTDLGEMVLWNIKATVQQGQVELGVASDENFYTGPNYSPQPGELVFRMPAHVVRYIERVRAGGPAEFSFSVRGELSRRLQHPTAIGCRVRSEPLRVYGGVNVSYEKEVWVQMLNTTGFGENVVVEIPLPPAPNPDWEPIWKAIATARDTLKTGGDTAWKSAVVECRHALETWHDMEHEDHGPGWKAPSMQDRKARTRKQRLDSLRWHLYQCAHEAAHTPADKWTRDDAVLVLAALSGLLAIRNP